MTTILEFLLLTLLGALPALAAQEVVKLKGSSCFEVVSESLDRQRPSCALVKSRIREFSKTTAEADNLLSWYSLGDLTPDESKVILDYMNRSPYFLNDRLHENLIISYAWSIPKDVYAKIKASAVVGKELKSSKTNWTDNYNGFLPEGVSFTVTEGEEVVGKLEIKSSYERFCLDDKNVLLALNTPELRVELRSAHNPDEL